MSDTQITKLSSLDISPDPQNNNNGFYAPQLSSAQRNSIPTNTLRNGALIYNSDDKVFQVYVEGSWNNLFTTLSNNGGTGLSVTAPLLVPTGESAAVEVAANDITGFIYYDTTNNVLKLRNNAGWVTITTA